MWTNPHCAANEEKSLLLNGSPLFVNTSARVAFMANMSGRKVITMGSLRDSALMRNGYLLK